MGEAVFVCAAHQRRLCNRYLRRRPGMFRPLRPFFGFWLFL